MLDYEGVPFRCRHCHKVGHLLKDCPLNKWNSRQLVRNFPQVSPIQDALSHGYPARDELPRATEEFHHISTPHSGGIGTLSSPNQRSVEQAKNTLRKHGRPPLCPPPPVPGSTVTASGDSFSSGMVSFHLPFSQCFSDIHNTISEQLLSLGTDVPLEPPITSICAISTPLSAFAPTPRSALYPPSAIVG